MDPDSHTGTTPLVYRRADFTCGHRFESLEDIELRDRREKAEHREKEKKEKLRAERLRRMQAFQVPDGGREGVKNSLQILA